MYKSPPSIVDNLQFLRGFYSTEVVPTSDAAPVADVIGYFSDLGRRLHPYIGMLVPSIHYKADVGFVSLEDVFDHFSKLKVAHVDAKVLPGHEPLVKLLEFFIRKISLAFARAATANSSVADFSDAVPWSEYVGV